MQRKSLHVRIAGNGQRLADAASREVRRRRSSAIRRDARLRQQRRDAKHFQFASHIQGAAIEMGQAVGDQFAARAAQLQIGNLNTP